MTALSLRPLFLFALLATLTFATSAPADETEKKPGDGKGADRKAEFMKRFDKNNDGKLDDSEKEAAKAAFGDRKGGGDRKAEFMKRFDKNNDGKLDDAEKNAAREAFEKLKGKDGQGPFGKGEAGKEAFIKRFDKNGDGKLDDNEKDAARAAMKDRVKGGKAPPKKD